MADGGFTPSLLAEALDFIDERDRDTFDLDDDAYEELVAFAKSTARDSKNWSASETTQAGSQSSSGPQDPSVFS